MASLLSLFGFLNDIVIVVCCSTAAAAFPNISGILIFRKPLEKEFVNGIIGNHASFQYPQTYPCRQFLIVQTLLLHIHRGRYTILIIVLLQTCNTPLQQHLRLPLRLPQHLILVLVPNLLPRHAATLPFTVPSPRPVAVVEHAADAAREAGTFPCVFFGGETRLVREGGELFEFFLQIVVFLVVVVVVIENVIDQISIAVIIIVVVCG
mmetsp:Transcript_31556/g.66378  ORF Transcript_31556/g.66378 Transcript_31556/m.66378 type:complete len:208 (+) Transcript_31556:745-1368(+)